MAIETLTDEKVEELRSQYGEICVVETVRGTAVFRQATAEERAEAFRMQLSPNERHLSSRYIANATVVHPAADVFGAWCRDKPGIPRAVSDPISRLDGLNPNARARQDENGDTCTVSTVLGDVTVKTPDERQWAEYQKKAEGSALDAFEYLALACIVSPPRPTFQEWLKKKPGIAATLTPHITRLAGAEENERLKE